ncbi:MAG: DUF4270 domain-containing protein [Chitinophagaceae bacterium]|nr:DUF4270 domain-containing protein [Chitinophagaceae bacterium]
MRKLICAAGALFCVYAMGCKKADIQFGEQFVDAGITNIVMVDTITPALFSVFRDSVPTSQSGTIITGSYNDPVFGKIAASSFFVLASPGIPDMHISAAYDSLVLQMRSDSSFYGDTSVAQRFNIHELSSLIEFGEDKTYLYNSSSFPVYATPLGSAIVTVRPSLKDSVSIRLSDTKGQELFELIQSKSQEVLTSADFEQYFKGLRISADDNTANAAVYGFSDSVTMRLYYHESDPYLSQKYIDFVLTSRNKQFNRLQYDRSGTALDVAIPEAKEISPAFTGGSVYVQPLTGVLLKMRFPTLRSLLARSDYVKIMKAELMIAPSKGSYSHDYMLPPQLIASSTNINNQLGGYLAERGNAGSQSIQYGGLTIDWLYGEDTRYTYDVTAYLQSEIRNDAENTNGLIFAPPSPGYNTKLNRLVVDDNASGKGGVKLKVYYISVQQ